MLSCSDLVTSNYGPTLFNKFVTRTPINLAYRWLRHAIDVRNTRLPSALVGGLSEVHTIVLLNLLLPEVPEINDKARVGPGPDLSIREGVTVDLDMVRVFRRVGQHDLGLWIIERNW